MNTAVISSVSYILRVNKLRKIEEGEVQPYAFNVETINRDTQDTNDIWFSSQAELIEFSMMLQSYIDENILQVK